MSAKTASTKSAATPKTAAAKPVAVAAKEVKSELPVKTTKSKEVSKTESSSVETKPKTPRTKKSSVVSESEVGVSASASEGGEKVRRVVNNEEVEKLFDELHASLDAELQVLRDDKNHSVGVRFLRSVARQVKSLKSDCFRLLSKKVRKPSVRSGNSGFMKSVKISPEMAKFCSFKHDQLVSRVDVTKAICNYVKEKNLQNPSDRRQFNPDDKLGSLLGVTETITYYTLQKHIQKHFPKA